jgi:choline dehydrogenase-like flavoprotein
MANLNINSAKEMAFDAIVIGSGVSGGWAAKELTEKGLRVLMLERGRALEHVTGYENAMKAPWEMQYAGRLTLKQIETHPKLSRDYPYNEMTEKYWMTDSDSLYKEEKRFDWFRPNIVGGKSIMWGRQSYRLSDLDFEANLKEGVAVDSATRTSPPGTLMSKNSRASQAKNSACPNSRMENFFHRWTCFTSKKRSNSALKNTSQDAT